MSPNTMIGKLLLPDQLDPKENRFNNNYFDRTVYFIEDFNSHDYINFGQRYLNLAGYEQMHDDIIEYFKTVTNPIHILKERDCITGNRYMCNRIINTEKRIMVTKVDPNEKRRMVIRQERMNNTNDNKNN